MGKFTSDRAIREDCDKIWKTAGTIDPEQYVYSGEKSRGGTR